MAVTGKKINELDSLTTVSNQTVLPAVYVDGSTVNSTAQKISVSQISNKVQSDMSTALANKQDLLTAGNNITISNNIISATDTTYTAGDGISIQDNVISATGAMPDNVYTTDNLIAGTNISITQVPAPIIDQYTKALWNFEEGTSDMIAGYTLAPTNMWIMNNHPGTPNRNAMSKFGQYGICGNNDGRIAWNISQAMSASGQFTIDFWLKRNSSNPYSYWPEMCLYSRTGDNQGSIIFRLEESVYFNINGTTVANYDNPFKNSCPYPNDQNWHHVAFELDTTQAYVKVFFDGILKVTYTVPQFIINTSEVYWMIDSSSTWYWDEIRLSNIIRWTENFTPFDEPYVEGGSSVFQINNTLDISKQVSSDTIRNIVSLTQAQYDTLAQESAVDANTFYVIVE